MFRGCIIAVKFSSAHFAISASGVPLNLSATRTLSEVCLPLESVEFTRIRSTDSPRTLRATSMRVCPNFLRIIFAASLSACVMGPRSSHTPSLNAAYAALSSETFSEAAPRFSRAAAGSSRRTLPFSSTLNFRILAKSSRTARAPSCNASFSPARNSAIAGLDERLAAPETSPE